MTEIRQIDIAAIFRAQTGRPLEAERTVIVNDWKKSAPTIAGNLQKRQVFDDEEGEVIEN